MNKQFLHEFELLKEAFLMNSNNEIAFGQKKYMRNKFEFFGLKTDTRREIQKPFLKTFSILIENNKTDILFFWNQKERDFHQFAIDLLVKEIKKQTIDDIELFEYLIEHNSWWDSVDFIATKLVGSYFLTFPNQIDFYVEKWIHSNNMWLQRSAIIFQLKYKSKTDTNLLSKVILQLNGSNEFFINKAIGWSLREYSKFDANWVLDFVNQHTLSTLSKREALKHLSRYNL